MILPEAALFFVIEGTIEPRNLRSLSGTSLIALRKREKKKKDEAEGEEEEGIMNSAQPTAFIM